MDKKMFTYGFGIWIISFLNLIFLIEKSTFVFHMYLGLIAMVVGLLDSDGGRK